MTLSDTAKNTMLNALGALFNSGTFVFKTAGGVAVATIGFQSTAFNSASSGSMTAKTMVDDTNAAGGTTTQFAMKNSGGTDLITGTVTVTGGGGDFTGAATVITAAQTVSVTALTIALP